MPPESNRELPRDRESEPRPVHVVRDEGLEDAAALTLRDTRARISHVHAHAPVVGHELEIDATPVRRPPERIAEEIRDDLQHAIAVREDDGRLRDALEPVVDLATASLLGEGVVRVVEDASQVDLLLTNREAVRLQLREIENVPHEPFESVGLGRDHVE